MVISYQNYNTKGREIDSRWVKRKSLILGVGVVTVTPMMENSKMRSRTVLAVQNPLQIVFLLQEPGKEAFSMELHASKPEIMIYLENSSLASFSESIQSRFI